MRRLDYGRLDYGRPCANPDHGIACFQGCPDPEYLESCNCERCGRPKDFIEITTLGDREPRFIVLRCPCHPRCTFCRHWLDDTGHCENFDCWAFGYLIPIPA